MNHATNTKKILINILFMVCFSIFFILVAFLGGYASNANKYQPELKRVYSIFVIFHLIINFFLYCKKSINWYTIVSSLTILVVYLLLYGLLAAT